MFGIIYKAAGSPEVNSEGVSDDISQAETPFR